jgi:hypothetical protein
MSWFSKPKEEPKPKRWEYLTAEIWSDPPGAMVKYPYGNGQETQPLNYYGRQGWELVQIVDNPDDVKSRWKFAHFKKELLPPDDWEAID